MSLQTSRRSLVRGAAWTAPAILATSAVPAYAASTCSTCTEVEQLRGYWEQKGNSSLEHIDFGSAYWQKDNAWTLNRDNLYANAPGDTPRWDNMNSYGIFNHGDVDMVWWDCDWSISRADGKTQAPEQVATVRIPIRNLKPCYTYTVKIITEGRAGWERGIKTMPTKLNVSFNVGGQDLPLTFNGKTENAVRYQTQADYQLPYPSPADDGRIATKLGSNGSPGFTPNPDVIVTFTVPRNVDTSGAYMMGTFIMPKPTAWQIDDYEHRYTQKNNDDYHLSAVLLTKCAGKPATN